jgi:AcrR family transcriptional regulator
LQAAAEVFAELGYSRTTVRDIGKRAGILNGSLYYHFDSKEAMVGELLVPFFRDLKDRYAAIAAADAKPRDTVVLLIQETLRLATDQIHTVQLLQRDWRFLAETFPYVREGLAATEKLWVDTLEAGVADGLFRPELDARMVYRSIRSSLFDVAYWNTRAGRIDFDRLADMQVTLFLSGISSA